MYKRKNPSSNSAPFYDEAVRAARATQRPGQTKEQTKIIAQGIQKGIAQYKKQQSAKARELDRKLKQARSQNAAPASGSGPEKQVIVYRQSSLAWILLGASWAGFVMYWLFGQI